MRKLNSLNTFKKRKLGGLYRISRPPTNPQNFTPKTVSKVKKRKKVNHNHNFKNYNDDFLTDMDNFLFEPVNTDTGTEVISPKKKT